MTRSTVPLALVGALLAALQVTALAQSPKPGKVPPRVSPNVSATTGLPAGIDSGTSASSDSMPLGTPVPPVASADKSDQNLRSAAARAAARPTVTARRAGAKGDCPTTGALATARVGNASTGVDGGEAEQMASRNAPKARGAKPEPQALPGSGFTGSSNGTTATARAPAGADSCN